MTVVSATKVFVGVETGGTKTVCRVVEDNGEILKETAFPTTTPDAVSAALIDVISSALPDGGAVSGVGVASFGPVVVDRASPRLGEILTTPKPGWSGSNLARVLSSRFEVPVSVDTDVNAAALAEQALGAGRGINTLAYITVGTGIGGGLSMKGRTLKGALHPEIGHLRLRRATADAQPSVCPFHEDCAEGLASGPAVALRLAGRSLDDAPDVRRLLADYLGQLCAALVLAWSPGRIVLGGGVIGGLGRLDAIEIRLREEMNGYCAMAGATGEPYLKMAHLEHSGLEGAIILARRGARRR